MVIVGGGLLVLNKHQAVNDWFRLLDYHPDPNVVAIADQDMLTPYARHLVYVYHTQLEDASTFNQNCKVTDQSIVLGCTVVNKGIYIYQVSDPQLNGIEQVTEAYEMLHAAYARLSPTELTKVNSMVVSAYTQLEATNPTLKTEEQEYASTEGPGAVVNEMHSTLGAEVANLPPNLENYYKQYFEDRSVIVDFANQYQAVFNSRKTQVAADDQQLSNLNQQISTDQATLNTELSSLTSQQTELNTLKSSGQFESYNSQVPGFNAKVDAYNSLVAQVKDLVTNYNLLADQRNSIALEENQLVKEISSQPSTLSTQ